jgi:hypothetical protein
MTKYDLILTDDQFITDRHGIVCLTVESGPQWVGESILNAGTGVEYTVVDISDGIVRLAREPKPQVHDE